ncbi:hypothetical protein BH688_13845 [Kushneria phosphatilytica]|nr:hypothetical protein BH688_13845 [Kushneria phosphatilytica]
MPNWLQHLRMLDRMTVADRAVIERVMALHNDAEAPRVRHGVSYRSSRHASETPILAPGNPGLQEARQADPGEAGA